MSGVRCKVQGNSLSVNVILLLVGPGGPGAALVSRQSPEGSHFGRQRATAGMKLKRIADIPHYRSKL